MLIKITKKYQDSEVGKVYDIDDLRDVDPTRAQLLIGAGVAEAYAPKKDKGKSKPKDEDNDEPKDE